MNAKLAAVDASTKPRPLPEQDYVSLAEAVTWTVEGNCRNDEVLAGEEERELGAIKADREEALRGIDARASRQQRYERCYELLRELCSNESIMLIGAPDLSGSGVAASNMHEVVAPSFFLPPLFCWRDRDSRGISKTPRRWLSSDWMT